MGNMQNCVSSSITNGTKSPVSPMIRPGFGPSSIDRCPCFLTRTCEKSITGGRLRGQLHAHDAIVHDLVSDAE